ncbi:MAG: TolC family protein, partial [Gemmatimonadota bacterium]
MPRLHLPVRAAFACVALAMLLPVSTLRAQEAITLQQAIALAQEHGQLAQIAAATRDAARYRDQSFYSLRLPQLSLGGTIPSYNRSIIQVIQPDGSTLFRPQDQLSGDLTATVSQSLPWTGGDLFFSSSLAQLSVTGQQTVRTWSSTPFSVGLRQPIFRPNAARWDRREEPVRLESAERSYREAREDIAIHTTNLFFDLYAARVQLANAKANAAINDTLYTLNKGRFEVGKIGENDLLQSELALLRARNSADGAQLDYQRALSALCLAVGVPPATALEITVVADLPTYAADTTRAVAEALRNR